MARLLPDVFKWEPTPRNDGQKLNVLLVEDNPIQQLCAAHLLKQLGHSVNVTGDGFGALAALQRDRSYDVILMDCQLPLMDGLKATRFIRGGESNSGEHVPIIGMSANAVPEECFQAGMDDFLRKPLQKLLLKAVLARWIREKRGRSLAEKPEDNLAKD